MEGILDYLVSRLFILPAVIIGLSFHEWGHAFAAYKMGDPTARNLGRLTLNPLKHIDPMGFIMMIIFGFGWAKPVPVNPRNYRNYKVGEIVVSLAGVTMNLIIALISSLVCAAYFKYADASFIMSPAGNKIQLIIYYFIFVNLALLVFNLIPIYPLDGFHVAEVLLSKPLGPKPFLFLRNYGQYILIGILLLGKSGFSLVGFFAGKLYSLFISFASWVFGL